jgi:hypothetical protein
VLGGKLLGRRDYTLTVVWAGYYVALDVGDGDAAGLSGGLVVD